MARRTRPELPPCPDAAGHTPHPTGYVANSNWADDAMVVADVEKCAGCDLFEVWVPKRPDLRIAVDWPPPDCDWGNCDQEGVAERLHPGDANTPAVWLPVCKTHTGVKTRRPSPGRGQCTGCGKDYALSTAGVLRAHDNGWNRCTGSGRPPRKDGDGDG